MNEPREHFLSRTTLAQNQNRDIQPRGAVDTLVEAARLPFDPSTRRDLRLRAAQLATVELGDNAAAIDMYRSVLASSPNDLEVIERLAHLLGVVVSTVNKRLEAGRIAMHDCLSRNHPEVNDEI